MQDETFAFVYPVFTLVNGSEISINNVYTINSGSFSCYENGTLLVESLNVDAQIVGMEAFVNAKIRSIQFGEESILFEAGTQHHYILYIGDTFIIPSNVTIEDNAFFFSNDCNIFFEDETITEGFATQTAYHWVYNYETNQEEMVECVHVFYFYSENEPSEPGHYWHYVDGNPVPWN